jgi:hypothetical protein
MATNIKVEQKNPASSPVNADEMTLQEKREEAVKGVFQIGAMGLVMLGQFADAGAIGLHGDNISHEVAVLADDNEAIAAGIDSFIKVGPYAALIMAVLPLALQLAVNHGVLPGDKLSAGSKVVPPSVLEAQVKTDLMRMHMEALKEQQKVEEELAQLQKEMQEANSEFASA